MTRLLVVVGLLGAAVVAAYLAATKISFRMLGNPDDLRPTHRRLLDDEGLGL